MRSFRALESYLKTCWWLSGHCSSYCCQKVFWAWVGVLLFVFWGGFLFVFCFSFSLVCLFVHFSFKADIFPDKVSVYMKYLFSGKKEQGKKICIISHKHLPKTPFVLQQFCLCYPVAHAPFWSCLCLSGSIEHKCLLSDCCNNVSFLSGRLWVSPAPYFRNSCSSMTGEVSHSVPLQQCLHKLPYFGRTPSPWCVT